MQAHRKEIGSALLEFCEATEERGFGLVSNRSNEVCTYIISVYIFVDVYNTVNYLF